MDRGLSSGTTHGDRRHPEEGAGYIQGGDDAPGDMPGGQRRHRRGARYPSHGHRFLSIQHALGVCLSLIIAAVGQQPTHSHDARNYRYYSTTSTYTYDQPQRAGGNHDARLLSESMMCNPSIPLGGVPEISYIYSLDFS